MAAGLATSTLFGLAVVLLSSFIVGEFFERIGLESIIGYIITGLILGPAVLNIVKPESLAGFGTIGATLILFQAGLREQNAADIFRHRKGLDLGIGILIGSFLFIFAALVLFGDIFLPEIGIKAYVFIALAYSLIDIGVPSKIMLSRGMLREDIGRYTIKSAVINVTAGFAVLTALVLTTSTTLTDLAIKIGGIAGFAIVFYILHEFMHRIDDFVIMFEEAEAQFAITFALLLSMAYVTDLVGLSSVIGAFFAGVLISRSEFSDSRAFQEKIKAIGMGLFIPIFFAWFGLGLKILGPHGMLANIEAATFLFVLSTVSKLGIGYIMPLFHKMNKPLTIATSLLSLDIETLVVLLIGINLGVLDHQILQIFAPSVLMSTVIIVGIYFFLDRR
ncbi:MAG: cation:proton antiporter [Candidatus Nanohaloarchaea archaeon]